MRWKRDPSIVPVLMFHSIGMGSIPWIWSELSESVDTFEKVLAGLAKKGFRTVSLQDLYEHMSGVRQLPGNSIVLTFDDGYLDNWVNAVPLLRKYGMRGTVYVTPEFVQDGSEVRPVDANGDEVVGFMNWEELRRIDAEGVLDVQCHALTHTWYFSGPKVVDIHRSGGSDAYPWMAWNARPDRKPFYLDEQQDSFVRWGQPIFEHQKSLVVRRFFPDAGQVDEITEFVAANGGATFFEAGDWRSKLDARFPVLQDSNEFPGKYESEEERQERVLHELTESREILQRKLGKPIEFFSWPGGGVDDSGAELARQAGFKSWTLSSWQEPNFRNCPGADASGIKRVSGHSQVFWKDRLVKAESASWIISRVLTHQGSLLSKLAGVIRKTGWIVATVFRGQAKTKEPSVARR
ncbi:MAG: polysaccharide deacetylase family protein [Woeseiaceae bacterium]